MRAQQLIKAKMLCIMAGVILWGLLFSACNHPPAPMEASSPALVVDPDTVPEMNSYGIQEELYSVAEGRVRRNQTLADLLLPYGVSMQEVYRISLLPDSLIDEKKIKPDMRYFFYTPDSLAGASRTDARLFVYEKDPLRFVVVSIGPDSIFARVASKPLENRLQFASGSIETSLWESMMANEVNPMLAMELSEIFAWSIDFFGIQQGDRYKVVYEEAYVDSAVPWHPTGSSVHGSSTTRH
jgi:hypothetical protein